MLVAPAVLRSRYANSARRGFGCTSRPGAVEVRRVAGDPCDRHGSLWQYRARWSIVVYNVDKCSDSAERERRRCFNQFTRIRVMRRAEYRKPGSVGMSSCAGAHVNCEVPLQPRVGERVPRLVNFDVARIVQCLVDPLKELWQQGVTTGRNLCLTLGRACRFRSLAGSVPVDRKRRKTADRW
jgi:hypothetical protein